MNQRGQLSCQLAHPTTKLGKVPRRKEGNGGVDGKERSRRRRRKKKKMSHEPTDQKNNTHNAHTHTRGVCRAQSLNTQDRHAAKPSAHRQSAHQHIGD